MVTDLGFQLSALDGMPLILALTIKSLGVILEASYDGLEGFRMMLKTHGLD